MTTLKKFVEYNCRTQMFNTLKWEANDKVLHLCVYNDKYYTISNYAYLSCNTLKNIEVEYPEMSDIRICEFDKMSCHKFSNVMIELSLDEAIDCLIYMDDIPEYIYNNIDMSSDEAIEDYVYWHYHNIGPIFDYNGDIIIPGLGLVNQYEI